MQLGVPPEALALMNDSEWLREQHITQQKPITQICTELGLHWKNANGMIKRRLAKFNIEQQYHFSQSYPELEIKQLLDGWGVEAVYNSRTIIPPKELDIYIPSMNIAIEYCGLIWHSSAFVNKNYHLAKLDLCAQRNIRLITIFEDEWIHNKELVVRKLSHILGKSTESKVYARKCSVVSVTKQQKISFLEQYHIQGDGPSSIEIGLTYNGQLVALAAFRAEGGGAYSLNRYAASMHVIGGCSKLLAHFIRLYSPMTIITFADRRWSSMDNMYEACGFVLDGITAPDYAYVDTAHRIRLHRSNFRKDQLSEKLGVSYDSTLTEWENMQAAGIHRIYNCGLLRYTLTP